MGPILGLPVLPCLGISRRLGQYAGFVTLSEELLGDQSNPAYTLQLFLPFISGWENLKSGMSGSALGAVAILRFFFSPLL